MIFAFNMHGVANRRKVLPIHIPQKLDLVVLSHRCHGSSALIAHCTDTVQAPLVVLLPY